ncbi:hypothetical protein AB1N83_002502 [Pleurotus pulmonarius]
MDSSTCLDGLPLFSRFVQASVITTSGVTLSFPVVQRPRSRIMGELTFRSKLLKLWFIDISKLTPMAVSQPSDALTQELNVGPRWSNHCQQKTENVSSLLRPNYRPASQMRVLTRNTETVSYNSFECCLIQSWAIISRHRRVVVLNVRVGCSTQPSNSTAESSNTRPLPGFEKPPSRMGVLPGNSPSSRQHIFATEPSISHSASDPFRRPTEQKYAMNVIFRIPKQARAGSPLDTEM